MDCQGYQIVRRYDALTLEMRVNDLIEQGWKPVGGIQITVSPAEGQAFFQSMVKDGKENPDGHHINDES